MGISQSSQKTATFDKNDKTDQQTHERNETAQTEHPAKKR